MKELSANQRYKQAHTSLSFKDWLEREKAKGEFIKNSLLEGVTKPYVEPEPQSNQKQDNGFSTGIPKPVIAIGLSIIVGAIVYKKLKK